MKLHVGLAITGLAMLTLGGHWCRGAVAIDSCLDAGLVFDYTRDICDEVAVTHQVIPYSSRHKVLVLAMLAIAVSGLVWAAFSSGQKAMHPLVWLEGSGFAAIMLAATTALAVWSLPGLAKVVFAVPFGAGAAWAIMRIKRRAQ